LAFHNTQWLLLSSKNTGNVAAAKCFSITQSNRVYMEVVTQQPYYRLKYLMLDKYGENSFSTGLTLIASWLSYQCNEEYTEGWVRAMCDITKKPSKLFMLSPHAAEALASLFKLRSTEELYTVSAINNII
jgi:hypothetical protein